MAYDRIEGALIQRIGDFRGDPARRVAADRAIREAKTRFPEEADCTTPQLDWIVDKIARLELEHGPQLHELGVRAGYRGQSTTLTDTDQIAYRERRAREQQAAKAAEQAAKVQVAPLGNKFGGLAIAKDRNAPRYGNPRFYPRTNRNW
jgi:hypothetical protein